MARLMGWNGYATALLNLWTKQVAVMGVTPVEQVQDPM